MQNYLPTSHYHTVPYPNSLSHSLSLYLCLCLSLSLSLSEQYVVAFPLCIQIKWTKTKILQFTPQIIPPR